MNNQRIVNEVNNDGLKGNKTKSYPSVGQSFGITGIVFLGMILLAPIIFLADSIGKDLSTLLYYVLAMGVPLLIVHHIRKSKTKTKGFNLEFGNWKTIILVIITAIALQIGVTTPIMCTIPMPDSVKEAFMSLMGGNGLITFVMAVIAAPFLEEFIFRGIILDGLLKRYSPLLSILLSSFLFGIIHMNPWQLISAMVIGVFAGWVYHKTRKLSYAIIIHMANNFFAIITSYFYTQEQMMELNLVSQFGGVINAIVAVVGAIIVAGVSIYLLNKMLVNSKMNHEDKMGRLQYAEQ